MSTPIDKLHRFAAEHAGGEPDAEELIRDYERDNGADDLVPQLLRGIVELPWDGLLPALRAARANHCDEFPEACMCEWCGTPRAIRAWAVLRGVGE